MILVHHLENSRSQRVLWLLEELGLPCEVKRYPRNPETMLAPPELRQVHPRKTQRGSVWIIAIQAPLAVALYR